MYRRLDVQRSETTWLKIVILLVVLLASVGLGLRCLTDRAVIESPPDEPPRPAAVQQKGVFSGFCEASSILGWEGGFLVADNETEDRIFRFTAFMEPFGELRLSEEVEDVEALALLSSGLLVVGSQSANRRGKRRPLRERVLLFGGEAITPNLSVCTPCEDARRLPPKKGGLSVEGAAQWSGALWLGLRSPLVAGKALLLRVEGDPTSSLTVVEQLPIDLEELGVRDMVRWRSQLLILAGPADATKAPHKVFRVESPGAAPIRLDVELPPSTEGLAPAGDGSWIAVTDGDGQPGEKCRVEATWQRVVLPLEAAPLE